MGKQRWEDQLAERRARLMLDLSLLADKKTAKLIELLEELRRDHPNVTNRVDQESDDLSTPADPKVILEKIDQQASLPGRKKD